MAGTMISLTAADGFRLDAYHAPAAQPVRGGLVLAMEIFGVTGHIRALCDGFAAEGYDVLAPALYDRAERHFAAGYGQADVARAIALRDRVMFDHTRDDVQAAIDWLAQRGHPRIHITGYCYGGTVAFLAACRCAGLTSAVGYYGRHIVDFIDETPRCPTMLHFGSRDRSIPLDWVERIRARHPAVSIHVYDAHHGFNSDRRQNYDAAAAAAARARTLAFFESA